MLLKAEICLQNAIFAMSTEMYSMVSFMSKAVRHAYAVSQQRNVGSSSAT